MSDEPVEDDDSGSDAAGASSSSDSEESAGRPGYTSDHVTAAGDDDSSTGASGGADDGSGGDDPSNDGDDPDDGGDPSDGTGTASNGESTEANDSSDEVDDAPDDPDDASDDPTAGDSSPTDSTSDDSSTDDPASAHAPVGTQAPSPDDSASAGASTASAGQSTASAASTGGGGGGGGGSSILSGGIGGSAPPDDEEMPLTEHIEEMLTRLAIVVIVASVATLAALPFANDIIIQMWYDVHSGSVEACRPTPQSDDCVAPHVYGPLELVLTRIRVAALAGLLVALPLGIYQTYRFMRPGLYPHERRYYLAAVPFSLVLGIVGMLFAYFVVLPLLFAYFIGYTEGSADLAFQLAETMNLILLMMGMLAIIFQIPLLIMLAIMMGITTRRWLERRRLYFWGLFLGVAVIFGPDPTGMAPFLLTATMVVLFEGTLLILRWTGR